MNRIVLYLTFGAATFFLLPSCNSFKSCPEQVAQHMPLADILFVAVDSAGFFKSAGRVRRAADCVSRDGLVECHGLRCRTPLYEVHR